MMLMKTLICTIPTCLFLATQSSAAVVSADFGETLDLPSIGSGARVFVHNGAALGAGAELTGSHDITNPSGWRGYVDVDLSATGLLTLSRDLVESAGDYDYALITISNIVFSSLQAITGVTTLSENLLDPSFPFTGSPLVTFTSNSVSFLFDTTAGGNAADFRFNDGGVATYQINTSDVAAVPLPASLPLLSAALGGIAVLRRRRKAA